MAAKLSAKVVIPNKRGLHARASAKIVEASARFKSEIHVIKDGTAVNGLSIMGLMMLAASIGSEVEITTEGPDQDDAMKAALPACPVARKLALSHHLGIAAYRL
jgi:phosphocarrier protein HPr